MSDTNHKGLTPKGTGREIAPLYRNYLEYPYLALNRPFSAADCRDMITQCLIFTIRSASPVGLTYDEAFKKASELIAERNAFGTKKYGEGLKANNGYDPNLLLLEELADAGMYATMGLEESGYIAKDAAIRSSKYVK